MSYAPLISKIRVHNPNKKGSAKANRNYTTYIATREGVSLEKVSNINDVLNIEGVMEKELREEVVHQEADNKEYIEYMARRPHSHGLFGNINTENLKEVSSRIDSLTQSGKIIYRGIISLGEKDGEKLNFRNVDAWNNYLKQVMPDVAQMLGISSYDHTWVAAFHAEEKHPHVHYMLWDNQDKVKSPYIHPATQQKIRIYLENEMFDDSYERAIKLTFKEELDEMNKMRNTERTKILEGTKKIIKDIGYVPGVEYEKLPVRCSNEYLAKIADETNKLISELPGHGSFKYKYLPVTAKEQLDKIVDLVLEKTDIRNAYDSYLDKVQNGLQLQGKTKTKISAETSKAEKDLRRRIANKVLVEIKNSIYEKYPVNMNEDKSVYEGNNMYEKFATSQSQLGQYYIEWDNSYKKAMDLLYGEERDVEKAFEIFEEQAILGNALAIFETAKLIDRELLQDIDKSEANEYYDEGKRAFEKIYDSAEDEYKRQYSAYRVGKYFYSAIGSIEEADYEKAKVWLERATDNRFAQYTLGKLYLADKIYASDKKDSLENKIKARELFEQSIEKKGNPYASYELGKIYASGIGTNVDTEKAQTHYAEALNQFLSMSNQSTDDNLFYRLGRMYTDGLGTEADVAKGEKYIYKAAELGNEIAKLHLASMYLKKDDEILKMKGIELLEELAKQENSLAQYKLGVIYADKENEKQGYYNLEKAIEHLEKSAEQGNEYAQYKLGVIYADKENEKQGYHNLEKAIKYLEKSAEQGNEYAQYKLGVIYADKENEKQGYYNLEKAIKYLKKSAEQGNEYAQYKLGVIYADSEYHEIQNMEKAIEYLKKSAEQGNEYAQYKLGVIYADSEYPETQNMEKAIEYLKKSAEQGNQFAQYKLGTIYADKKNPELHNVEKAIEYLKKSAEQGNEYAQYKLGVIYADSEYPETQNMEKAIEYLKKSAEQGNQFAQYKLGSIYADRENLELYNVVKAIEYLKKSAEQGNQFAQCKLGTIYYFGKDVPKDTELGKYWLRCAAEQGNQFAQSILDGIGIDFSYCLIKGVLSSMESFNRQVKQKNAEIANSQSKQAAREKYLHRDREHD